jgi:molecular chaperone HscB
VRGARDASLHLMHNHFELFGLAPAYTLDAEALERSYRKMQTEVHPDRFANAGDAERRASLQWTTRVNEAYGTLRDPVQRAKHLLDLQGVDVAFETNTQMPTDFLLKQLELREEVDSAVAKKDAGALDAVRMHLSEEKKALQGQIAHAIDARKDYAGAADLVRKLMFLDKVDADVDAAYEAVE